MKFEDAVVFTMRYEVGPWFTLDADTRAGLCSTSAQMRKTGYVNNPADPGGETKFGIAKNANPNVDIKSLTWDSAKALYKRKYWDPLCLDQVQPKVAILIFDCSVNHGPVQAAKFLQGIVGATEDGQVGPKTLQMVGAMAESDIVTRVLDRRRRFFKYLVLNKPLQIVFLKGWLARCDDLEMYLK